MKFTPRLPQIRLEVARMKQDGITHDLPGFLHGLKIIFAEGGTVDKYGRLTFEMGDTTRASQRKPLPPRSTP